MNYHQEENNYPKAFLATGIILALLMALSYFLVFKTPPKEDEGTGGILVNYGTTPEGMGNDYMSTEEPSVAEKANHVKPTKVTQAPPTEQKPQEDNSDKKIVTQNTEDAPEVTANSKKPSSNVATTPTKSVVTKPTVNQNALYKGKSNGGTGEGDGTGNKPGNQGVPTGSTLTPDYGQGGNGTGGSSLQGINGRSFSVKPSLSIERSVDGVVVVDIIVDRNGNVTYAQAGRGTTVDNAAVIQKCEDAARRAHITSSEAAPDQQRAKIVFRFKSR